MTWRTTRSSPVRRPARHGRHGREGRSSVVSPPLPPLETRADRFELAVASTSEFLRDGWPELREVRFEVASMPPSHDADGIPRWLVSEQERRIVLFRLPIERLGPPHRTDELQRRMIVESCVFQAAAEYLHRDPWELGPERYRPL